MEEEPVFDYVTEKYAAFYGPSDPTWDFTEISSHALKERDESIAREIHEVKEQARWYLRNDDEELAPEVDKERAEDDKYEAYRAEKNALIRKVKTLLAISSSEEEFDINNYPGYFFNVLSEILLRAPEFHYEETISKAELKELFLKLLANKVTGLKLVNVVFARLDQGFEAEHLGNILSFPWVMVPFFELAKSRINATQASILAKRAIKLELFTFVIYLTEQFPDLDSRYSIAVVGNGMVNTIEEVFTELSKYIDGERKVINCLLESVEDPVDMIRSGLLPHASIENIYLENVNEEKEFYTIDFNVPTVLSLLAANVPLDQIEWWTNLKNIKEALRYVKLWSFYTKEGARDETKEGSSYSAIFAYPDLLYRTSQRPITDMSMFRLPRALTLKTLRGTGNLLPVTRYALGMRKSLFFENRPTEKEFCGTFYYLEQESSTFLRYETAHVSFSKFTAYKELKDQYYELTGSDAGEIEEVAEYEKFSGDNLKFSSLNNTYIAYLAGLLRKDLRYTPSEYLQLKGKFFVKYGCFGSPLEEVPKFEDPEVPVYIGSCPNIGLYAVEDTLDQPLCILGKILGIELIILKYMIGSRQVVTEVLDTRPRDMSFRNLVFS